MSDQRPERPDVHPSILQQLIGNSGYLMPDALLPIKDCAACRYHQEGWRDGGHCYMFRDEPEGDRCGQFTPRDTK